MKKILVTLVLTLVAAQAFAQGPVPEGVKPQNLGPMQGCAADFEKACGKRPATPAEGKDYMKCVREHEPEYSAGCKEIINKGKKMAEDHKNRVLSECKADIEKFCSKEKEIGPQMRCIRDHRTEVSAACAKNVPEMKTQPLKDGKLPEGILPVTPAK
jgi:hypothetical protein